MDQDSSLHDHITTPDCLLRLCRGNRTGTVYKSMQILRVFRRPFGKWEDETNRSTSTTQRGADGLFCRFLDKSFLERLNETVQSLCSVDKRVSEV